MKCKKLFQYVLFGVQNQTGAKTIKHDFSSAKCLPAETTNTSKFCVYDLARKIPPCNQGIFATEVWINTFKRRLISRIGIG